MPKGSDFCCGVNRDRIEVIDFESALPSIVLQKSKVEGQRIFRKNTKRKAIADSYNLYRVTEVAYEFNVRR